MSMARKWESEDAHWKYVWWFGGIVAVGAVFVVPKVIDGRQSAPTAHISPVPGSDLSRIQFGREVDTSFSQAIAKIP